jgi:hypothetical protein
MAPAIEFTGFSDAACISAGLAAVATKRRSDAPRRRKATALRQARCLTLHRQHFDCKKINQANLAIGLIQTEKRM